MPKQRDQIVIALRDKSTDSRLCREWLSRFFEDDNGALINNASHYVKLAVIKCYIDQSVPIDPRYVINEAPKTINGASVHREAVSATVPKAYSAVNHGMDDL